MHTRRVILLLIGLLALFALVLWQKDAEDPAETRSSLPMAKVISAASDVAEVADVTRELSPVVEAQVNADSLIEDEGPWPRITGHIVNQMSGEAVEAVVALYEEAVAIHADLSTQEGGYSFEVERGVQYGVLIKGGTLPKGYAQAVSRGRMLDGNTWYPGFSFIKIPKQSTQMEWKLDLMVYQKGLVSGQLLDEKGAPISGARVVFDFEFEPQGFGYEGSIHCDANGRFAYSTRAPGSASIRFELDNVRNKEQRNLIPPEIPMQPLLEGQRIDLGTLRAARGSKIFSGRIVDQSGAAFSGLEVACFREFGTGKSVICTSTTNLDGVYTLPGLIEGAYEIDLTYSGRRKPPLVKDMTFAWEVPLLKSELQKQDLRVNLGEHVVPRPSRFHQIIKVEGGVLDSYWVQIETLSDSHVEKVLAAGDYDWNKTPPWFNYNPENTILYHGEGLREIACRLPHAPIRITLTEPVQGSATKKSEITIYPSLHAAPVVVMPAPE